MRILLVDDSRIARRVLKQNLQKLGHESSDIFEAGNGREALEVVEEEAGDVDLVLSDWNMPEMDGLTLVKELQDRPEYRRIPIVMVSSESERERIVEAIRCGARNYITKPFTPESLSRKIRDVKTVDRLEEEHGRSGEEEEDVPDAPGPAPAASLSGILSDVGLAELTQFINSSQMSGDLKIEADGEAGADGTVFFRDGEVHDCVYGDERGEEAFFAMLTLEEGSFQFEVSTDPVERTTERGTLQLLMDALRMKDEMQLG